MKQASSVYVQLGYEESVNSKKEILQLEMSLLNLIKTITRYHKLRLEEGKIKSKLKKTIKELKTETNNVQSSFPFMDIPQKTETVHFPKKKEENNDNLELQLKEIQEKLNNLGKRY